MCTHTCTHIYGIPQKYIADSGEIMEKKTNFVEKKDLQSTSISMHNFLLSRREENSY